LNGKAVIETQLTQSVMTFEVDNNYILALTSDFRLLGKAGFSGQWVQLSSGIESFRVCNTFIAAKQRDGAFYIKKGLTGAWVKSVLNNPYDFVVLFDGRIAVQTVGPSPKLYMMKNMYDTNPQIIGTNVRKIKATWDKVVWTDLYNNYHMDESTIIASGVEDFDYGLGAARMEGGLFHHGDTGPQKVLSFRHLHA
jgi:hypothetical protein